MAWKSDSPYYPSYEGAYFPAPQASRVASAPRWKFCSNCQAKLTSAHQFCAKCGTKTDTIKMLEDIRPKNCAKCTGMVEKDALYCHNCGEPVDRSWQNVIVCKCGCVPPQSGTYCVKCGKQRGAEEVSHP